jgi:hypothetical protein
MGENKSPIAPPPYDGPCRELAATRIEVMIEKRRKEITSLEALLKVAKQAEAGSPLEVILWEWSFGVGRG